MFVSARYGPLHSDLSSYDMLECALLNSGHENNTMQDKDGSRIDIISEPSTKYNVRRCERNSLGQNRFGMFEHEFGLVWSCHAHPTWLLVLQQSYRIYKIPVRNL